MKMKTQPSMLLLWIILSRLLSFVEADDFAWYCDISANEVMQLEYVPYSETQNDLLDDQGGALRRRQLPAITSTRPFPALRRRDQEKQGLTNSNNSTEPPTNSTPPPANNTLQILVRQCYCASYVLDEYIAIVYCPTSFSHCVTPKDTTERPACINMSHQDAVRKRVFPLFMISFCLVLVGLLCTRRGGHALNHVLTKFLEGRQEQVARRLLQVNPYLVHGHIQRYLRDHGLGNDYLQETTTSSADTALPPPNQLSLKTRIYERSYTSNCTSSQVSRTPTHENNKDKETSPNDDDHDLSCTICFAALETGDRVGALHCRHVFHVSCLKDWLACRNVCPLCLKENIATPSHVVRTTDTTVSTTTTLENIDPSITHIMEHEEDPLQEVPP
jgi:hypothetical protein